MNLFESLHKIEKKYAITFFAFLLAAILGSMSIYNEFIRDDNPTLKITLLNNTNVLDVKEEVSELKIFYGDEDIKNLNKTLSVVQFQITNEGNEPILNEYYDEGYPFYLSINEGKFVKAEQIKSTNDYLKKTAIPIINSDTIISLPKIILEPSESYTIKTLIIHKSDSSINFSTMGKIAKVKSIELVSQVLDNKDQSYWRNAFAGGIGIQAGRISAYTILLIILLIIIILPVVLVNDFITSRQRKKIVKQFKLHNKKKITNHPDIIFSTYISEGLYVLEKSNNILSNNDAKGIRRYLDGVNSQKNKIDYIEKSNMTYPSAITYLSQTRDFISKLNVLNTGHDNKPKIDNEKIKFLSQFIEFATIKES
ncbi:MAG: hypothetical protein OCD01_09900 [Fibrobacterales bacterium]